MPIPRKKEALVILENARLEIEKLITACNLEVETYDDANEKKQEKMDDDEESELMRDGSFLSDLETAQDAIDEIIDTLKEE